VAGMTNCPVHGQEYLQYKCRFCCSVAIWQCGSVHYCEECHSGRRGVQCPISLGSVPLILVKCPLNMVHPPSDQEFILGCGICVDNLRVSNIQLIALLFQNLSLSLSLRLRSNKTSIKKWLQFVIKMMKVENL